MVAAPQYRNCSVGDLMAFAVAAPISKYCSSILGLRRYSKHINSINPRRFLSKQPVRAMSTLPKDPRSMTDADWRKVLEPQEYNVLRQKGTEPPGIGEYDKFYPKEGHFVCRACKAPLYSAKAKFDSGCGWPAFDKCYKGAIDTKTDTSLGMRRIEILCATCGGHLGHVFEGERITKTNERHCVNSLSVKYVEGDLNKEETKVV